MTGRVVEESLEVFLEIGGRLVDEALEEMVSKSRLNLRLVVDRAVGILEGCGISCQRYSANGRSNNIKYRRRRQ